MHQAVLDTKVYALLLYAVQLLKSKAFLSCVLSLWCLLQVLCCIWIGNSSLQCVQHSAYPPFLHRLEHCAVC